MRNHDVTDADRQTLCQAAVTLNGQKAKVTGYRNDFATVANVKTGEHYEWAWATVAHVVANRAGAFRS